MAADSQKIRCQDHLGNWFESQADMARAYGVKPVTLRARLAKGMSVKEALFGKEPSMYIDHLGNKYKRLSDMCDKYNITIKLFNQRLESGWSVERALTFKLKEHTKKLTGPNGKKYDSIKEMANDYGISYSTVRGRLRSGKSVEEALMCSDGRAVSCIDHLGNTFDSKLSMCKHYGISAPAFDSRIKSGWDIEKALTYKGRVYKDHKGNEFEQLKDMLEKYGIPYTTYSNRVKNGWTLKKILTTPVKEAEKVIDHLGNEYESERQMLLNYDISYHAYKLRMSQGWSSEEALTKPMKKSDYYKYKDLEAFGFKFKSIRELIRELNIDNIDVTTLQLRLQQECIEIEAVSVIGGTNKHYSYKPRFIGLNNKAYYDMPWSDKPVTTRQVVEHFRPDLLDTYDMCNPTGEYRPYKRG